MSDNAFTSRTVAACLLGLIAGLTIGVGLASQPSVVAAPPGFTSSLVAQAAQQPERPERVRRPFLHHRSRARALPAELQDRILETIAEIDGDWAVQFQKLREESPAEFERELRGARGVIALTQLKERNPELFAARVKELRLQAAANRLAAQLRLAQDRGDSQVATQLERELRTLIGDLVNVGLLARGWELLMLEKHIEQTRKRLAEDANDLPGAIERRFNEIMSRAPESVGRGELGADN